MLFQLNNNVLENMDEVPFKLEKDIQDLVEKNLDQLFSLDFVETEFPIESYRFDTVAFNKSSMSFVIIEYKRGRNESLVDQGYAYLYTLLNRKADFVLLYNEKFSKSCNIKDFDWTQSRIMFISPQFTDYQKRATSFSNMAFELYEWKRFVNDVIRVDEIKDIKKLEEKTEYIINSTMDATVQKVVDEVVVYTEQNLFSRASDKTIEIYEEIKTRVLELGNIKVEPKKFYIAFKGRTNIIDVIFQKKRLLVSINLKEGVLKDSENKTVSVAGRGRWGNGDYEMSIDNIEDVDYLMTLVRQSYKVNQNV